MTLKEVARDYKEEIMDGIAWVAIWKVGRNWKAATFWLDDDERISDEDICLAMDIVAEDENAILINEYYCAHMGEGKLADIMAGIRFHYENGYNQMITSTAYIEALETETKCDAEQQDPDPEMTEKLCKVVEFAGTPAGIAVKETVCSLDQAIAEHDERQTDIFLAKWEVFKLVIRQLTGVEFCFSRTDEYFGLCTEDEKLWLMKEERRIGE